MGRFLTVNSVYLVEEAQGQLMLIADYHWWDKNESEIRDWTKECLTSFATQGMIVKFSSEEDRNLFLMRWANG